MQVPHSSPIYETSTAEWALSRQSDSIRNIRFLVPSGYQSYCRILHRVNHNDGSMRTWKSYADSSGTRIYPDTKWVDLARHDSVPERVGPMQVHLDDFSFERFLRLAIDHLDSDVSDQCIAGYWVGRTSLMEDMVHGTEMPQPVTLGRREHVLFSLSLRSLLDAFLEEPFGPVEPPGILWLEDRSWYVATEVDYDSTIVGGSAAFVSSLVGDESLEAIEVDLDTDLRNVRSGSR